MSDVPTDIREINRKVIADFRTLGAPAGRAILLLTTTGAKSGKERTTPLMYVPDGDRLLVIAANAGAVHHPSWFHNLVAHPTVRVEVGAEDYPARATALQDTERDEVFDRISTDFPFFAGYQDKLDRTIPVIALTRI